jgi:hypothetical protein
MPRVRLTCHSNSAIRTRGLESFLRSPSSPISRLPLPAFLLWTLEYLKHTARLKTYCKPHGQMPSLPPRLGLSMYTKLWKSLQACMPPRLQASSRTLQAFKFTASRASKPQAACKPSRLSTFSSSSAEHFSCAFVNAKIRVNVLIAQRRFLLSPFVVVTQYIIIIIIICTSYGCLGCL